MSVLEADDYQSERELLQPKSYNTFDFNPSQKKGTSLGAFPCWESPPARRCTAGHIFDYLTQSFVRVTHTHTHIHWILSIWHARDEHRSARQIL